MSKYYFIREDEDGTRITHEFETDFHDEIAERFNEFLLGCGFVFYEGCRYELTQPETTETEYYGTAEADWPFETENEVMSWTSEELTRSEPMYTITEPGEFQGWQNYQTTGVVPGVCPKCKISRSVMATAKCYDMNCGLA